MKNNVPKLRFPGFSGEWEEKKLGEVTTYTKGYAFKSEDYVSEGIRVIRVSDLGKDSIKFDNHKIFIDLEKKPIYKNYILNKNDVIITTVGSKPELLESAVGRGIYVDSDDYGLLNQNMLKLNNLAGFNNRFIFSYINTNEYISYIKLIQRGNANQSNISVNDLLNYRIFVTFLEEQTKIADFITVIDDKIQQLTKKKELLEQYKKGVMRDIFSQKIRFKDDNGNEYPVWETQALGEIGDTYNGLIGKIAEDFGEGKPYIQYKQIFDSSKILIDNFGFVRISSNEKQNKARYGDIFFTTSSETPEEVGYSSILLNEINEVYLNSFCFGYRIKSFSKLTPTFAQYLFRNQIFRTEVIKLAQGSTRYNISKIEFMKIIIELPIFEEQIKIADFLKIVDDKIFQVNTKLEQSKLFKKSLLQQMFI